MELAGVAVSRAGRQSRIHPSSGSWLIFAAGFASLTLVTVTLKYLYLAGERYGGIGQHLAFMTDGPGLRRAGLLVLLFALEPFEAFLLLGLGVTVGRCFRLSTWRVVSAVVLFGAIVGGLDILAYGELGSLLTVDTIALATRWAWLQPVAALHFTAWRLLIGFALGVGAAIVPVVFATKLVRSGRVDITLVRTAQLVVLLLVVGSAGAGMALVVTTGRYPAIPFRGYWSTSVSMFTGLDEIDPDRMRIPNGAEVQGEYMRLVFPENLAPERIPLVVVSDDARRLRHVLVVSLETAPRKYYRIEETDTPTLARMSRHALTSEHHFTAAPMTSAAVFSIVSGLYPRSAIGLGRFGGAEGEGLGSMLASQGYEATYIDSYALDWEGGRWARTVLGGLGFSRLLETWGDPRLGKTDGFENASLREELSFELMLQSVMDAQAHGHKAFVVLVTNLGHYPWPAPAGSEILSASGRMSRVARRIDDLFGRLLATLGERGLTDDTIVVVTGDHGLRFRGEFEALGETPEHGELQFNVPLLIYAPSVFRQRIRVPYVTSHVDLVPTLLDLLGVRPAGRTIMHGLSLLDRRLEDRLTFLMSGGITTVNGFHWRGRLYTSDVTGRVTVRPLLNGGPARDPAPLDRDVRRILDQAEAVFLHTAVYFIQHHRAAPRSERPRPAGRRTVAEGPGGSH